MLRTRRYAQSTRPSVRSVQASATKQVATKVLTSPYLFVGLLAWTGFAAYYLFPQKEQDFILPTKDSIPIPPSRFRPAVLVSSEITSKDTRLLTLALPPRLLSPKADIPVIWSIYVKDDDIYVERPYTPLEGVDDKHQIKIWVKMYPDGEVGKWLHSKKSGNAIEIRGPVQTHLWKNDVWDEVIMISGGTGITPFCQLIHHEFIRKESPSKTRFTLLHSSKSPGELPPPVIMEPLVAAAKDHPDRFRLRFFVDTLDDTPASSMSEGLHIGRIDKDAVEQALDVQRPSIWYKIFHRAPLSKEDYTRGRKVLFLVCGPDPMISAIAGPLGRTFSQGAVTGILGSMGFQSDEVQKLGSKPDPS